jgi:hypothetical protein
MSVISRLSSGADPQQMENFAVGASTSQTAPADQAPASHEPGGNALVGHSDDETESVSSEDSHASEYGHIIENSPLSYHLQSPNLPSFPVAGNHGEIASVLMDYSGTTPAQSTANAQSQGPGVVRGTLRRQPGNTDLSGSARMGPGAVNSNPREYSNAEKDKAAHVITRAIREKGASKATVTMMERGYLWKNQQTLESINALPGENTFRSMKSLSAQKLKNLKDELRPLTEEERGFLDRGMSMNYNATHFTNNNLVSTDENTGQQVATLFSRDKVEEKGTIPLEKGNGTAIDIIKLGNSNHVFFGIEPGDTPKKQSSKFGSNKLIVPLNHPAFQQTATVILNDKLNPQLTPKSLEKYGVKTQIAEDVLTDHSDDLKDIFVGKDIVPGLLMTAISDSRKIGREANQKMMAAQNENDFNEILNGLYRPEIKVPNHLFVKNPSFVTDSDSLPSSGNAVNSAQELANLLSQQYDDEDSSSST